ncbi:CDKA2 protein, partial [Polypterus senegalus]
MWRVAGAATQPGRLEGQGGGVYILWATRGQPSWIRGGPREESEEAQAHWGPWPPPGGSPSFRGPGNDLLPPQLGRWRRIPPGTPGVLPSALLTLLPHKKVSSEGETGAHPGENKRARLPTVWELESGVGAGQGSCGERKDGTWTERKKTGGKSMKPPGSQGSQSTYADLLAVMEEMGKEIRPTYAGSKSAMERLKRGIIHARALVRECLAETERNART